MEQETHKALQNIKIDSGSIFCVEAEGNDGNLTGLFMGTESDCFNKTTSFKSSLKFYDKKSAEDFLKAFGMAWGHVCNYRVTEHQYCK